MRRLAVVAIVLVLFAGCGRDEARTPVIPVMLMIQATGPTSLIESDQPIPPTTVAFEGARGNVRVTVAIGEDSDPPTLNDVLFRAEGRGKLSLLVEKPGPGRKPGRLRVACLSGGEESTADVDAGPWLADPMATIAVESPFSTGPSAIGEGGEVVLARFSAIGRDRTIRLTWMAVFSKEPIAPRVKAGMKPRS